jgi:GntR family transcriptional regulator
MALGQLAGRQPTGGRLKASRAQLPYRIRDQIADLMKDLGPNERLPGEAALAEALSVSRATIRDALAHLERDALIIRRHGIGTFVAPRPAQLGTVLNQITPIPDVIAASGYTPRIGSLRLDRVVPPPEVSRELQSGNEHLTVVSIQFLADDHPAIYITYYLHPDLQIEGLNDPEFDGRMVDLTERTLNVRVQQTHVRISASAATKELGAKLSVKAGHPLLRFTTVAFLVDGRPAYCSVSYQDSKVLEVRVVRTRSPGPRPG